ncbi:pyridoxal-phosphate dependent enzyme [Amycolatopsis sp. GA6-003]|uniref:pyridoxal-phosphate dependent enzyme n=1 Tax=Amycolatopsis sp. GA6-003 TaxID=2652444 RepID=UPI003916F1C8
MGQSCPSHRWTSSDRWTDLLVHRSTDTALWRPWPEVARNLSKNTNAVDASLAGFAISIRGNVLLRRTDELRASISPTPVSEIVVEYRGRAHELALKHESHHPTGSIKHRTAVGLLAELDRREPLEPGTVIVESTSGNLGLALARLIRILDCRFIAVIDRNTPEPTVESLASNGVDLEFVNESDGHGGYLLSRLRTVAELLRSEPGYRWTDQYHSPANPRIHQQTTAPEILRQGGAALDAVYVAVSTGGTLAGISAHLRTARSDVRVVAVDAVGSLVTGDTGHKRLITGLGASRKSCFLTSASFDFVTRVAPAETVPTCRMFRQDTGIALGGSSGSVVHSYLCDLERGQFPRRALGLCPDDGSKYEGTIYADKWLDETRLSVEVHRTIEKFRSAGAAFTIGIG